VTDSTAHKNDANVDGKAGQPPAEPIPGPLDPLIANLAEIEKYLTNYLVATKDRTLAAARRTLVVAVAAICVAVVVLTLIVTATFLLLHGLANAVAYGTGAAAWVGEVVVGAAIIAGCAIVGFLGARGWLHSASRTVRQKYEQRHLAQRGSNRAERPARAAR
jgi:hypothetical protein